MAHEVFWRSTPLDKMTPSQWESLCDGCALCCLHKVEDEDTDEVFYTTVVCHLLDFETCRCTKYEERTNLVPSCVKLRPQDVSAFHWLPPSCAYRLVHEGKELPEWHPLVSGDPASAVDAGVSVLNVYEVRDDEISEEELVDYVID
ncbi:YcgN family cysteine cluster protein [Marinobacterium arenosum]|uniref:YcgN family cysteine cluster protein n=1 Tax=Marinobacterium arenosum TaxID=2862496 RepID=UPI001C9605C4|nr:YcgN family cysteine cluster protein [Marinobacterium arenosum]MBY4677602.1 YcgN family cysteine cluster protein [Marinobacterium arenosum]